MSATQQHGESAAVAAKAIAYGSTGGVSVLTVAGIHLEQWVVILTIIIALMTIAEKLWRWYKEWRDSKDEEDGD